MSPGERALLDRVTAEDYGAWRRQVERTGHCSSPVRVSGGAAAVDAATGEVRASYDTRDQPDHTLLIACGDRRASVCPSCAETYRRDMWNVVAAGVRGRPGADTETAGPRGVAVAESGVPASVAEHPRLFVTLTAPSFGPVHRAPAGGGVCRPRSGPHRKCVHGRPVGCGLVHDPGHHIVGSPLCADCYDYVGSVLWNAAAGALWHRTRIAVNRALARLASAVTGERVSESGLGDLLRVSYIKVMEMQRRGLAHFHVIVRLDGVDPCDRSRIVAPPAWATAAMLAEAVASAVDRASVAMPSPDGVMRVAQWGSQRDISDVSAGGPAGDSKRLAAYLAKYSTKTASDAAGESGALARRITVLHSQYLRRKIGPHLTRMVETCWKLGGRKDLEHLRRWAHTLGFRGHFATKSRRYSVTMGALRAVRRQWRARQRAEEGTPDPWATDDSARADDGGDGPVVVREFTYTGKGYLKSCDLGLVERMAEAHAIALAEYRDLLRREAEMREWCDLPVPQGGSSGKEPREARPSGVRP
ncbi:replication initiator [Nocardiopsis sediminis]|uniref:Replication initiator n=1 Tax=Nocardiopsis sediminis TaxID=1778267 RepID=A0ABV8FHY5_9ACTN